MTAFTDAMKPRIDLIGQALRHANVDGLHGFESYHVGEGFKVVRFDDGEEKSVLFQRRGDEHGQIHVTNVVPIGEPTEDGLHQVDHAIRAGGLLGEPTEWGSFDAFLTSMEEGNVPSSIIAALDEPFCVDIPWDHGYVTEQASDDTSGASTERTPPDQWPPPVVPDGGGSV